jgi:hypothetical protein
MGYHSSSDLNLAYRVLDLDSLGLPGCSYSFESGRELIYRLPLSPTVASRIYNCELRVPRGVKSPQMIIVEPDLKGLAGDRQLPHVYPYAGAGTLLCLWHPKNKEWNATMRLSDTYIPWTLRWLWYFEDWLSSDDWVGEGVHPDAARRIYGVRSQNKEKIGGHN